MSDPVTTIQTATNTVNALSGFTDSVTGFIPKLIAGCSLAAAVLPKPDPESKFFIVLGPVRKTIDILAFNMRHAKNKD